MEEKEKEIYSPVCGEERLANCESVRTKYCVDSDQLQSHKTRQRTITATRSVTNTQLLFDHHLLIVHVWMADETQQSTDSDA